MIDLNNSYRLLYKQALIDPSQLTEEDILGLLVKYPYSEPLVFSYERRKQLLGEPVTNKETALLYASNSNLLWSYIHKPVEQVEEISPEVEEYVTFEEWDNQLQQAEAQVEEVLNEDHKELDRLAYEGGVIGDYFIFDQKDKELQESEENEVLTTSHFLKSDEKEDVSLYNDDLMPYSFRWWLYKTRLEHADTYQPFVVPNLNKTTTASGIDFKKVDDSILDQQIKENIIHFQDPEMKLSEAVKQKPVQTVQPKKSDVIIERFIKEEPIIQPPSPQSLNNENMARQSAEDNYVLVTETLANIYIDQALYLKAIEVFRKLILKYPEKKSYFANRIQELEKNI